MNTNVPSKSADKKLAPKAKKTLPPQMAVESFFGTPLMTVVSRTADIRGKGDKSIFYAEDLQFPEGWSQNAVNITADKYFRHVEQEDGTKKRETSAFAMVDRIVSTIEKWGYVFHHFASQEEAATFGQELRVILLEQRASFNSPVWFNIGTKRGRLGEEQASACFINSIEDDMLSILQTSVVEGMLYKGGSGSGINYSPLRSSRELLSGGGTASGPVPFIASHDANGGAIKSGGGTRRAAKMNILNCDHGDILEFVDCKADAEKKARTLIAAGFDSDFRARLGVYQSVPFQNANHSVRVTDSFMNAVEKDGLWNLMARDGVTVLETLPARAVWARICDAAWECGDPGLQFDTMINHMHTCPADGRINSSNPCCIASNTLVDTSEGRIAVSVLEELARSGSRLPHVFAWDDENNLPVLRQINRVWVAGETSRLLEVRTDKGVVIRCTPEHRFLLHDGSYVEAQHLAAGNRLRKISRGVNKNRSGRHQIYHRVVAGLTGPFNTVWQNRFMWEQVNGPIPAGMDVHHKNEDATDDRLSNFELRAHISHCSEHSSGESNPRFMALEPRTLVEVWEALEREKPRKKNIDVLNVTPWRWNRYVRENDLIGAVPQAQSPTTGGHIQGMSWLEFKEWITEHRSDVNDRVESVTPIFLASPEKVYDLEVEGTHNFAVGSELHTIVVHNSEYMHLDDSACNLASLNLMKFRKADGKFDVHAYMHTVDVMITAQDILVDGASYPTQKIGENARAFRQLGLGYANLGALLMNMGLAYDSDEGRYVAGLLTAILCGRAYQRSAIMAAHLQPFDGYARNKSAMLDVIKSHGDNVDQLIDAYIDSEGPLVEEYEQLAEMARLTWSTALNLGREFGFRNSQATVMAPTGTIAFMMDCDTTGVEPETALVKHKKLVGGGNMKIVNQGVAAALTKLGYDPGTTDAIVKYVEEHGSVVGSQLEPRHLPIFDTSFPENVSKRSLRPEAHVLMLAAIQPFVSGAISKTCNLPESATREDISALYQLAWKKGLKAVALYRDNCKGSQPLSTTKDTDPSPAAEPATAKLLEENLQYIEQLKMQIADLQEKTQASRRKLPDERQAVTHKFRIATGDMEVKVYLTCGLYPDGSLGEIFLKSDKEGSLVSGLLDSIATLTSFSLQYGVPLSSLTRKFRRVAFEPHGWTGNPEIAYASSILDYVFRFLDLRFGSKQPAVEVHELQDVTMEVPKQLVPAKTNGASNGNGKHLGERVMKRCPDCDGIMYRTGSCTTCSDCGLNTGCA